MEVIVGKNAGFCGGAGLAIRQANQLLEKGPIYCLGEILHNRQVIEELEKKGMITVNSMEEIPDGSSVIFRAHGEPIERYQRAEEKRLKVEDLTCQNVKSIHDKVLKQKEEAFILIIGMKEHPETIGTQGFAGENSYVIETEEDILDAYMEYEKTDLEKIYVVSHTTFSSRKFDELADEIIKNFCEAEVVIDKTICDSTENRQLEVLKMARECDVMLIIGGKNSNNTKKLYEISKENCSKVYCIQTVEDVKKIKFNLKDKVGIMAGASTPSHTIEQIKEYLEGK